MSSRLTLFSAQTASANGSTVVVDWRNDKQDMYAYGTWGGASITLERLAIDGTTWIKESDLLMNTITLTANKIVPLSIPYGESVRAVLAGATGTTSLTVILKERGRAGV